MEQKSGIFSGKPWLYYVFITIMTLLIQVFMVYYILSRFRGVYADSDITELSAITRFCFGGLFAWFVFLPTGIVIMLKYICFKGKYETACVASMVGLACLTIILTACSVLLLVSANSVS